jgi:hypothetical protein
MKTKLFKTAYIAAFLTTSFWVMGSVLYFILPSNHQEPYSSYMKDFMLYSTQFLAIMSCAILLGGAISVGFQKGWEKLFPKNEKNS